MYMRNKKIKLDFYYWDFQCPLNNSMINLLSQYNDELEIHPHNILDDCETAKKMNIFYPTLTVVEDKYRYYSPLKQNFLGELTKGNILREKWRTPNHGREEKHYSVVPFTKDYLDIACQCTSVCNGENSRAKLNFCTKYGEIWGFLNVNEGKIFGGAEYIPSKFVPYDIPKGERKAFLTCVYLTDDKYDYKTAPLRKLEKFLATNYDEIYAISDEKGDFPNGNLDFFLRNGYIDCGTVFTEPKIFSLHLVEKNLKKSCKDANNE